MGRNSSVVRTATAAARIASPYRSDGGRKEREYFTRFSLSLSSCLIRLPVRAVLFLVRLISAKSVPFRRSPRRQHEPAGKGGELLILRPGRPDRTACVFDHAFQ